ncbi:uncharacterized protein LOC123535628 isoform X2 [Mercenaria mercenaria]|uniref:uncharacterized protein LOC123535628 isoform X2 n=1 Tax=Mercenaria mercenaria TaxID=6596 RepID=UPI001E1D58A1|nr:uncharacterized protein LOC123535628 isoform X2 [Mercenaria mercenaria]
MAKFAHDRNKRNRRRFGQAGGKHSRTLKMRRKKAAMMKIQERFDEVTTVNGSEKTCQERKNRRKNCKYVQHIVEPSQADHQCTSKTVLQQTLCTPENVFVGRKILHEWCLETKRKKKTKWYLGVVLNVVEGNDGEPKSVYNVMYEGDDVPHKNSCT